MKQTRFNDDIALGDIPLVVFASWRMVLASSFIALVFSMFYAFSIPPYYRAEASIRGVLQGFCPPLQVIDGDCRDFLVGAVSDAVASIETDNGFLALNEELDLVSDSYFRNPDTLSHTESMRNFFDALDIRANDVTALVAVRHSSDRRAAEIVNSIARYLVAEIEARSYELLNEYDEAAQQRLLSLPEPGSGITQYEALIDIERSALQAQIRLISAHRNEEYEVAVIDRLAALPIAQVPPRELHIIALGVGLGTLLGIGVAIVNSRLKGTLHSAASVVAAFGGANAFVGRRKRIAAGNANAFWQDVRVFIGDIDAGVIALTGYVSNELMVHCAVRLAIEFSRSGVAAAVVAVEGQSETSYTLPYLAEVVSNTGGDLDIEVCECELGRLSEAMVRMAEEGKVVILLPPSPNADLPSLRRALQISKRRVFIVSKGEITRRQIRRLMLAERGISGERALVLL